MVQTRQYKAWTLVYGYRNGNKIDYPRVIMETRNNNVFIGENRGRGLKQFKGSVLGTMRKLVVPSNKKGILSRTILKNRYFNRLSSQ